MKNIEELDDDDYEELLAWLHQPDDDVSESVVIEDVEDVEELKKEIIERGVKEILSKELPQTSDEKSPQTSDEKKSKPFFNKDNLYFEITNSKEYPQGTQFVLTARDTVVLDKLKKIGINMITLFRDQNEYVVTNNVTVYFYSDNQNIIPELTIPDLHYMYDATKKCYVVNSKIGSKTTSTGFKQQLPVPVNLVDIIYRDDNNKTIGFTFKPEAFKETFKNFTDKFTQKSTKRNKPGTIYAVVNAPFQLSKGGEFYILDLSRLKVSFDNKNAKFVEDSVKPSKGK